MLSHIKTMKVPLCIEEVLAGFGAHHRNLLHIPGKCLCQLADLLSACMLHAQRSHLQICSMLNQKAMT